MVKIVAGVISAENSARYTTLCSRKAAAPPPFVLFKAASEPKIPE